ncbi:50S ribosomal protein L6 [Candidatus Woesearchaeota archaeon]|nr:50S ribosomal protein L6 [Candidatus Woesearchaeota archaeon]
MKESIKETIEIPEGIEVKIAEGVIHAKGNKGELSRKLIHPMIMIEIKENKIILSAENATKREKTMIGTFKAHIKNILNGVNEGHVYKLKICSGHFPMNVSVSGNEFVIKNFMGETIPRRYIIKEGVTVKVEGSDVVVEGVDKELAGQTASSIEKLTKRPNFDNRIFQDGIHIYIKDGKEIK